MSLCSALDPLEDFLLAAATEGPGHGLNLSTNNGLDLTCQNYEGLNLSQHANPLNQGTNSNPTSSAPVVLNLTHQSLPPHQQQQQLPGNHGQPHPQVLNPNNIITNFPQHGTKGFVQRDQQQTGNQSFNTEVGLNLSLQNGINLSRQAVPQGSRSNIEIGYYYNDFNGISSDGGQQSLQNPDGANFTFNPRVGGDNSAYTIEQQRNSPLNLEHRSSPLNLTSVVPSQQHSSIRNFQQQKHNINASSVPQQQHSGCPNLPQQPQQQGQNNYFSSNDQFNWNNLFYNQAGCSQQNELDLFQSNDVAEIQQGQLQTNMFTMNGQQPLQQNTAGCANINS